MCSQKGLPAGSSPRSPCTASMYLYQQHEAQQPPLSVSHNEAAAAPQSPTMRGRTRRWHRARPPLQLAAQLVALCLVGTVAFFAGSCRQATGPFASGTQHVASSQPAATAADLGTVHSAGGNSAAGTVTGRSIATAPQQPHTLVIYVYSDTDPEYINNLWYFVRHGIKPDNGCKYILVIQQDPAPKMMRVLPDLPANAHYKFHVNECFDWGTFGWVLTETGTDTSSYTYFVLMNSSSRGPFLPAHWPADSHWTTAFTSRLSADVKLVGPTISCEGTPKDGNPDNEWRRSPHVQSYVVVTDQIGLGILRRDGNVLACHRHIHDAIWHAELGSPVAVLNAGYSLDSLMMRYQGVNWRSRKTWDCNARLNPYMEFLNDGISLDPLEVMFVKVKAHYLDLGWSYARTAAKFTKWLAPIADGVAPSPALVCENEGLTEAAFLKQPKTLAMREQGASCFDVPYYMTRSQGKKISLQDLPEHLGSSPGAAFDHFVNYGQWEGRPFRFTCGDMKRMPDARARSGDASNAAASAAAAPPDLPLFGGGAGSAAAAAAAGE